MLRLIKNGVTTMLAENGAVRWTIVGQTEGRVDLMRNIMITTIKVFSSSQLFFFFPTYQVRVVRFYVSLLLLLLFFLRLLLSPPPSKRYVRYVKKNVKNMSEKICKDMSERISEDCFQSVYEVENNKMHFKK